MSSPDQGRSSAKPLTVFIAMRLFLGLMPLYASPSGLPEGMPGIYKLLVALRAAGHEVHFIGILNPSIDQIPERGRDGASFEVSGTQFHLIELPCGKLLASLWGKKPFAEVLALYRQVFLFFKLRGAIKRLRPDVIYLGTPSHVVGALCGKLAGIPTVLRFYGVHQLYNSLGNWRAFLKDPLPRLAFRAPCSLVLIDNDGTQGDRVAEFYGVPRDKIKFWLNGVDKDAYRPDFDRQAFLREQGIALNQKIVLTANRLINWKRVDRIIRAAPAVLEKVKDMVFLIVGEGPERSRLEALSRSLRVEHSVRFMGAVPHERVYDYMNAADVYVYLTDVGSNLNVGVLEAITCGRCVVSVDDGGFDGVLQSGQEAILIPQETVDRGTAEVLTQLLQNDAKREWLGRAAREFAVTRLESWEERISKEVGLLEQVASSAGRAGIHK